MREERSCSSCDFLALLRRISLQIVQQPWQDILIDFGPELPFGQGYNTILMVASRMSWSNTRYPTLQDILDSAPLHRLTGRPSVEARG
jgi:hypothetical protein